MDSKINVLKTECDKILNDIEKIDNARAILSEYEILYDSYLCNETINNLYSKLSELNIKIIDCVDEYKNVQNVGM